MSGSASDLEAESGVADASTPEFDPRHCLFCNHVSSSLDDNLVHMSKKHGLFIPDEAHLVVEVVTLVAYFHLVIFGYSECLFCGSQRRSPTAAQQHMTGKGHCKIDILREDSEFRDFYDFASGDNSEGEEDGGSSDEEEEESQVAPSRAAGRRAPAHIVDVGDKIMKLVSGKSLSHRSAGKRRTHRHKTAQVASNSPDPGTTIIAGESSSAASIGSRALSKRAAKREAIFDKQMAGLRADDRRSLMHLPAAQQRVLVATAKAQVERARKEENEMKLKIQLKANKSIKN